MSFKSFLTYILTTIAAVLLVGCGEASNELLFEAVEAGNIEAVKKHLAAGGRKPDLNLFFGLGQKTPANMNLLFSQLGQPAPERPGSKCFLAR